VEAFKEGKKTGLTAMESNPPHGLGDLSKGRKEGIAPFEKRSADRQRQMNVGEY